MSRNQDAFLTKIESIQEEDPETPLMKVEVKVSKTIESYDFIEKLGEGGFGQVWKVRVKDTGNIIALKILKITNNKLLEQAKIEIQNLIKISNPYCHPYLSCYYDSHYDGVRQEMLIEMEYVKGVDLDVWSREFLKTGNYRELYFNLMAIMIYLLEGLQYIHKENLIHRDIKPGNILIDGFNFPKLVDFGLACESKICPTVIPDLAYTCCYGRAGTPVYMAPETVQSNQTFFASDIWSLGATIFKAATGNYCFPFNNSNDIPSVLETVAYTLPLTLTTNVRKLDTSINAMLNKDPLRRPTIEQLLFFLNPKQKR